MYLTTFICFVFGVVVCQAAQRPDEVVVVGGDRQEVGKDDNTYDASRDVVVLDMSKHDPRLGVSGFGKLFDAAKDEQLMKELMTSDELDKEDWMKTNNIHINNAPTHKVIIDSDILQSLMKELEEYRKTDQSELK